VSVISDFFDFAASSNNSNTPTQPAPQINYSQAIFRHISFTAIFIAPQWVWLFLQKGKGSNFKDESNPE